MLRERERERFRCGCERCGYPRDIFARLFHKNIEEIERSQSTVKAN